MYFQFDSSRWTFVHVNDTRQRLIKNVIYFQYTSNLEQFKEFPSIADVKSKLNYLQHEFGTELRRQGVANYKLLRKFRSGISYRNSAINIVHFRPVGNARR